MIKLTCTIFGTSDGMGGGDTVTTHGVSEAELDSPAERCKLRINILDEILETIGHFVAAVVCINGDWVIVDQDDHESGIIAVVKVERGV